MALDLSSRSRRDRHRRRLRQNHASNPDTDDRELRQAPQPVRRDHGEKMTMDAKKRKRLEAAGWTVGDARDFLKLSPGEAALVEMRIALSRSLRERRLDAGLTQIALAKQLGSSQSRVAKLEAGDASVSLELLIRALLAIGASRRDVANAFASAVIAAAIDFTRAESCALFTSLFT